jgi:hypothetical protein
MLERPALILALDFVKKKNSNRSFEYSNRRNFVINVLVFCLSLHCAAEESALGNIEK